MWKPTPEVIIVWAATLAAIYQLVRALLVERRPEGINPTTVKWARGLLYGTVTGLVSASVGTYARGVNFSHTLNAQEAALSLSQAEWAEASLRWLDEPSDLTATGLARDPLGPSLLAVDDDESAVLRLTVAGDSQVVVREIFRLPDEFESNDLEGIMHDGRGSYYAITSHRRLGATSGAGAYYGSELSTI